MNTSVVRVSKTRSVSTPKRMHSNVEPYFDMKGNLQEYLYQYVSDELIRGNSKVLPSKPNLDAEVNNCIQKQTGLSKPTMSQYLFHVIARAIAQKLLDLKGLVCWFSTGAGKTIVAAGIYDAFRTDYKIYYISRHDALKPEEEIHKYLSPIWKTAVSVKEFKKTFQVMSIARFSNLVTKKVVDLEKSCVIVDEAQYLFANRAVPQLRKLHTNLISKLKETKKGKVFVLTATPGDTMDEFTTLLNIIKTPKEPVITLKNYKNYVGDKIMFVNMYRDRSMYPVIKGNLGGNIQEITMNQKQEEMYMKKLKETKNKKTHQKWSNQVFTYTKEYSPKIEKIVQNIKKSPKDKHFIYSQYYKQGIQDLMKKLESVGYKRVTEATKHRKGKKFILAKASERFVASDEKNSLLRAFNDEKNKHGEHIQIFLATDSYNTGIDLKAVKHIHFMEPTASFLDTIQGVGRGARLCSHKHLPKSEWEVNVYTYVSKPSDPNVVSVDQEIFNSMYQQYYQYDENVNKLRTGAIDCKVMSKFHNQGLTPKDYGYIHCTQGNGDVYTEGPSDILKYERKVQKGVNIIKKQMNVQKERYKKAKQFKNELLEMKKKQNVVNRMKRIMDQKRKEYQNAAKQAKQYAGQKKKFNEQVRQRKLAKARAIRKQWKNAGKKVKKALQVVKELKRLKRKLNKRRADEKERLRLEAINKARKNKIRKEQLDILKKMKEKSLKRKELIQEQKRYNAERKKMLNNMKQRAGPKINMGKRKMNHIVF